MTDKQFTKILINQLSNAKELMDWGVAGGHTTIEQLRLTIEARKEKAKELVNGGMSQRQAAKILGVDHKTISNDLGNKSPKSGEKVATEKRIKTEEEYTLEHYQSALLIHAEQAIDLATMFVASLQAMPSAITEEAIKAAQRAAIAWENLTKQLEG